MLPPICDCSDAPGSGGNRRPFSRARRCSVPVRTPASTWIRHSSGSKLQHPIQPGEVDDDPAVDRDRAAGEAGAAAARNSAIRCSCAHATVVRTSAVSAGRTTASGGRGQSGVLGRVVRVRGKAVGQKRTGAELSLERVKLCGLHGSHCTDASGARACPYAPVRADRTLCVRPSDGTFGDRWRTAAAIMARISRLQRGCGRSRPSVPSSRGLSRMPCHSTARRVPWYRRRRRRRRRRAALLDGEPRRGILGQRAQQRDGERAPGARSPTSSAAERTASCSGRT